MDKYGCIYKITNIINGKIYIGKFVYSQKRNFKYYLGSGIALKRAYEKYGKENFTKEIIEEVRGNNSVLCEREIYWISEYNSIDSNIGYNITKGGEGGNYWYNNEYRENARQRMLNPLHPIHTKNRGRKHSEEETIKQNQSRDILRKKGKYKKPNITDKHLNELKIRQKQLTEYNKLIGLYNRLGQMNKNPDKINKQRKTMKEKGAPHLAKTFIFENIKTGEKIKVYGGFMDFCDNHNLSRKCMRNIADGKRKEAYNDWIVFRCLDNEKNDIK